MTEIFDDWPEKYDQWFETPIGRLVKKYESELVLEMLRPERGERILDAMQNIYDQLMSFDFPNAITPNLRKKCDVGRIIIARTREDLIMAQKQKELIDKLDQQKEQFV